MIDEMILILRGMRLTMEALAERQQRIYRAVERMDARLDMIERGAELREEIDALVGSGDMDDTITGVNVEACRSAPVRFACVEWRIEASVCCTPPFHSLNR